MTFDQPSKEDPSSATRERVLTAFSCTMRDASTMAQNMLLKNEMAYFLIFLTSLSPQTVSRDVDNNETKTRASLAPEK